MRTALICVDVQYDFIGGALGGEGCEKVIAPLARLALSEGIDLVVASQDWHPYHHCSFAEKPEFRDGSWPRHAVQNTEGAKLTTSIDALAHVVVQKGMDPECEAYSAFDGSIKFGKLRYDLARFLDGIGIEQLIVGGLTTEYCVRATVLDALRWPRNKDRGWSVTVPLDCCAGVDGDAAVDAAARMKLAGARLVKTWEEALNV